MYPLCTSWLSSPLTLCGPASLEPEIVLTQHSPVLEYQAPPTVFSITKFFFFLVLGMDPEALQQLEQSCQGAAPLVLSLWVFCTFQVV